MKASVNTPSTKDNYDLFCPRCGRLSCVRVVGKYEHSRSPRFWECKCYGCGKTFAPRVASSAKSRPEVMRSSSSRLLTPAQMDVYYLSKEEIAERCGLPKRLRGIPCSWIAGL